MPEDLLAQPDEIRRGYLQAVGRFNERLETICQRNRIERVLVDTSRNMGEVLVDYLNQRSRLNRRRRMFRLSCLLSSILLAMAVGLRRRRPVKMADRGVPLQERASESARPGASPEMHSFRTIT